ncbi:MAG: hypothetical protein FJ109_17505 [Deltaproteobacteria bacterium]|nr:hypothetical protein [Deltaproteobacteria bacterium]
MSKDGGSSRRAGELAQPSCSMVGLGSLLLETEGSFAVVIHGDADCINPFLKVFPHRLAPDVGRMRLSSDRFHVTGLTEPEVISGGGRERLLRCIETAVEQQAPEIVFVLGTCLAEMIGEDIQGICESAGSRLGLPVIPLRTGGLRLKTQAELLDRFGTLLASPPGTTGHGEGNDAPGGPGADAAASVPCNRLPTPESEESQSAGGGIVLLGYPALRPWEWDEVAGLVGAAGGRLAAELPARSSLAAWQRLTGADLVAIADPAFWPDLIALLERRNVPWVELPPPVGLQASHSFYDKLLSHCPRGGQAAQMLDELSRSTRSFLDSLPATGGLGLSGLRVAYCIGSIKNYVAGQLAREGLGELPALLELGCDVEVLIQEREDQGARDRVRRNLDLLGVDLPFRNFNDPGVLGRELTAGKYRLAYCQDHLAGQARQAGLAHVRFGALRPGFVGMVHNARTLQAALSTGFQGRYGRYLRR